MKGNAQGNWDPREGQQPFRPNSSGIGDRTTTLRRQLIGAEKILIVENVAKQSNHRAEFHYKMHDNIETLLFCALCEMCTLSIALTLDLNSSSGEKCTNRIAALSRASIRRYTFPRG